MRTEVLVSTMHQKDLSIVDKMNIKGDAIIINQCDHNAYIESKEDGRLIRMYSFKERGVGLSRNSALMRSNADICIMADDDMIYVDDYEEIIIDEFESNPNIDMMIFNVTVFDKDGESNKVSRNGRVRFYNSMRYGTVSLAFRRDKILGANIFFSQLFGGGAKFGSGEDSIFIWQCLNRGIKINSTISKIADVYNYESSWFTGYNEKYFFDKGALFAAMSKKLGHILVIQFALRKHSLYSGEVSFWDAYRYMMQGLNYYKRRYY